MFTLSSEIPRSQESKVVEYPYKFRCRDYQSEAWKALDLGKKRAVLCWHRGCGKDLFALNWLISRAIERPGVYLHCFPNFNQAKRAIWKSVHNTHDDEAIAYLDHFPDEIVKRKNGSDMMIELKNGSLYCLMGIDGKNAIRARGMNPTDVILSEYAFMDPESWYTIEPRVKQNKGSALFISTPNGKNHFYELLNYAKQDPSYYTSQISIKESKTIEESEIEQIRKEGVPEDFIQQEYYCSFDRGAQGSYYGKLIQKARDDGRITNLPIIPDLPCHTAWDIGVGDSTAIWIFQSLRNGCYNFIDYYENNGEGLQHYLDYLREFERKHHVKFKCHFVPHDMGNREFTSGVDRKQTALEFGFDMTIIPRKRIEEGIQAVRSILPLCSFHKEKCSQGIKCLDFYRKKYNDVLKVYYDEPCHDKWSHGADAFRMFAIGAKGIGFEESISMEQEAEALRRFWG